MKCVECGSQLQFAGKLPNGEFPATVDSQDIYVCTNAGCNRFGLLTIASKEDIF